MTRPADVLRDLAEDLDSGAVAPVLIAQKMLNLARDMDARRR